MTSRDVNTRAESIINRDDIAQAERLIRPHVRRTPVIEVDAADFGLAAARLSFKLELFQHAGSFKTRGAFTNLLTRNIPRAGVVAASGGNHGAAVAYASLNLGIPAKIFVPTISSPAKIQRIRDYWSSQGTGTPTLSRRARFGPRSQERSRLTRSTSVKHCWAKEQ